MRIVTRDRSVSVFSADWNRSEKEKETGAELPIDVGGHREAAVLARWVKIELHSDLIDAARSTRSNEASLSGKERERSAEKRAWPR